MSKDGEALDSKGSCEGCSSNLPTPTGAVQRERGSLRGSTPRKNYHPDPFNPFGGSSFLAKLSAAARRKLPSQAFAIPEKRAYPIHDHGHAMAALSEVAQHGTPDEQKRVRAAVHARYPSMGANDQDADE